MMREESVGDLTQHEATCQTCGQAAKVWILQGYKDGKSVIGPFCFACADHAERGLVGAVENHDGRPRMSLASLLILAGFLVGIVGIAGDYLGIRGFNCFGWYPQACVSVGGLILVLGAIFRVDALALMGGLVLGLLIFSELFGLNGSGGMGWKQQLAVVMGGGMLLIGVWLRRMKRGRTGQPKR
jgi:hypothetical protein